MKNIKQFFVSLGRRAVDAWHSLVQAIRHKSEIARRDRQIAREERELNKHHKQEFSFIGLFCFIILAVYAISLVLPMLWALMTSFKSNFDYLDNGFGLPEEWVNSYKVVSKYFAVPVPDGMGMRKVKILELVYNSLVYALGSALITTATALFVAYVCSRFKFKFLKVVYTVIIIAMIIPIVGSLPSELAMARALGLYDKMWGILLMKTYVTGLYFLIFYAAFQSVPDAYSEAAYIDGATNFQILNRIMIPMVRGPISTVVLLNFISYWNDYTVAMVYMPSRPTLAYGLFYFVSGSYEAATSSVPMKLAGCMVMAVPLLLIFLLFHKKLLSDVTTGGLKG